MIINRRSYFYILTHIFNVSASSLAETLGYSYIYIHKVKTGEKPLSKKLELKCRVLLFDHLDDVNRIIRLIKEKEARNSSLSP